MITLDGSQGEGGGQMLRTALALSTITQQPFRMINIRAGRETPGLKAQHLQCVKALEKLCGSVTDGAELGSQTLTYFPKPIKGGTVEIDIGTAGSITLVLQAVLLPACFANKSTKFVITGGTDVAFAMPYDYFAEIVLPFYKQFCAKIEVKLLKRGYYPAGSGIVELTVTPSVKRSAFETTEDFLDTLKTVTTPLSLTKRGVLFTIRGISHASVETDGVAEQQAIAAQHVLAKTGDIRVRSEYAKTASSGSGITLWALFSDAPEDLKNPTRLGASALGDKHLSAEDIGKQAANALKKSIASHAPVDVHLADNLVPFLALIGGSYTAEEITEHTKTNIAVANTFLGTITLSEKTITK